MTPLFANPTVLGDGQAAARLAELAKQTEAIQRQLEAMAGQKSPASALGRLDIFHNYMGVFVAAFLVALIATPIMRRIAIANGVVDRPSVARKIHRLPVAYLGGVAVYLGIVAGIFFAMMHPFHGLLTLHPSTRGHGELPLDAVVAVLLGMTVIMFCGLYDDVRGIDPRAKIAGQLFAAAALATQSVGTKVAAGLLIPIASSLGIGTTIVNDAPTILFHIPLPGGTSIPVDVVYWVGTAIIAMFVLGACNASNLIDGLDGLLSGVTAIAAAGLLFVALTLASRDDGPLDALRVVICLALLGGCLGFLPHNFNPATIFLGDAGSLMLGYVTILLVLTLGDTGKTHLVLAGVIIYAIPIIDTTLAIVRRKISGKRISDADDQHLHHMLKRALGVKGAVFALYAIGAGFAALGIALSTGKGRVTYALTLVCAAFIGVTSLKVARRAHHEKQAEDLAASGKGKIERGGSVGPPSKIGPPANGGHAPRSTQPASMTATEAPAAEHKA
ncbi:MAG: undecaprenyl/decaprenyl-phosphate alpha-N-acetylglucosaminyl 1-phosphate transferase [Phycisphaerales bacterium]|nr:undecaprenyl/decaprenyl-phosphate alpha-N-acetylglucosaminyl 1-phosphate transferase [Phycisphaerales bacterium]